MTNTTTQKERKQHKRITGDRSIARLKPPATGTVDHFVADGGGLALRVSAKGTRSWVLFYRFDGQQRRDTIGRYSSNVAGSDLPAIWGPRVPLSLKHACELAERIRDLAALGQDPRDAADAARDEVAEARANTFAKAVEEFIEHEAKGRKGNATADAVKSALLRHCRKWRKKPVASIDARQIGKLLRTIRDGDKAAGIPGKPYMANRLHAYLATFFRWCAKPDVKIIAASPMTGMDMPFDGEEARERWFTDDEIKALWGAADKLGGVRGAYLKLLMLTGKRKNKLAAMRWEELDDWYWTPSTDRRKRKKNKRAHGMPLPALAQRILIPLQPAPDAEAASDYVFPGRTRGSHLDPGTPLKEDIRELSGVGDFFYHAVKHTMETRLASLGVQPHLRDMVLDHSTRRGSGKDYDHWEYKDEIADALETWAAHVESVVAPAGVRALR